jgi:hypothetical protein
MLQEALQSGWQAVARQVRAASPLPLAQVEEVLALWELQPPGVRPPEAALLLADLLKAHHLLEEAQALLAKTAPPQTGPRAGKLNLNCREMFWPAPDWPERNHEPYLCPLGEEEQKSLLGSWLVGRLARGPAPLAVGAPKPGEAWLAWFLPQPAQAAWLEGRLPALAPPWSCSPADHWQTDWAGGYLDAGDFSRAAQAYPLLTNDTASQAQTPFSQDRQGLSRFKGGQPDAAQAAFHGLTQHSDPFWQRLGQVRLADLELSRLQAEPSP